LEEIGWTGFAVPQLRSRHAALTTGLTGLRPYREPLCGHAHTRGVVATPLILLPKGLAGVHLLTHIVIVAAAVWLLLVLLVVANRRQLRGKMLRGAEGAA
jgi:hypothetical protein